MTGAERVSARIRLTHGAWVVQLSRRDGTPSFDADLADGEAAQLASEGGVQALCAGLLHNREELTQLLGLERDTTEAATVIAGYRRWGEGLLARLEGVFAIVVWEDESETLLAVRDPLGSYPLFYAEGGGSLYVSNAIDALLVQPGVADAVNVPALADHLRHRWPRAAETYFEAVHRIPPGHALRESRSGRRVWRHWDPAPSGAVEWIDARELDQFDALFDRAVTRCLGHGRAGIFLSGGLDSVSVAAVAAASCRRDGLPDPWALSLAFPHPDCNEEPLQRAVATKLGLPQIVLPFSDAVGEGLIQAAVDASTVSPAPIVSLWQPAYDRLALEGKARGCSVILTGGGGDEWLTVSPYYAADLLRRLDVRGLYGLFRDHRRSHSMSPLLYLRNLLWRFGARPLLLEGARKAAPSVLRKVRTHRIRSATPNWVAPDPSLRRALLERSLEADTAPDGVEKQQNDRRYPHVYIREMRTALDHPLVAMELEGSFEQGRQLGLRILQPFWDAALVGFLYRTPPELLNRGGRAKGLVRETVTQRFPTLGFETQRKVTAARFAQSLVIEEGNRVWREVGGATALADAGVVDSATLNEQMDRILKDPQSRDFHVVWSVLALESWLRARIDGGGRG